jgi:hypothetical protein
MKDTSEYSIMAPGFFGKIGDFFKKVWTGVKKVVQPVANVVKKVWDVAKPIAAPALQMLGSKFGLPPAVTETALGLGEGILGKVAGEEPPPEQYEEEPPPQVQDPGASYYLRRGAR